MPALILGWNQDSLHRSAIFLQDAVAFDQHIRRSRCMGREDLDRISMRTACMGKGLKHVTLDDSLVHRSEERRVGKEGGGTCRSCWLRYPERKKKAKR